LDSLTGDSGTSWFALHVRSRYEKTVAGILRGKGYEWFLPTYKCRRRWSDRVKETELPLFPGYLFCRFNLQERLPILKTPGLISIVGIARTPIAVDEAEITALRTVVDSGVPRQPWPYLQLGQKVRIEYGALRGVEGILMDFKGQHRIVLSVTLLQRSVSAEIDSAWVTPLQKHEQIHSRMAVSHPLPAPFTA
jgi:transcription antitermination factor NusG